MKSRGFTVVEVMMALAVLGVGAAGVIAMQDAALIANTNARNLVTANGIAQGWLERIRLDALSWNEVAGRQDISETTWIQNALASPPAAGAGWVVASNLGADVTGAELLVADPTELATAFCTQLRLTRFSLDRSNPFYRAFRIEVRVTWSRRGMPLNCATLPIDLETQIGSYGFVYLVSAAQENAAPF